MTVPNPVADLVTQATRACPYCATTAVHPLRERFTYSEIPLLGWECVMCGNWFPIPVAVTADKVLDAIRVHRYHHHGETQLQDGLALALELAELPVQREVRLTARDRIDLLSGAVGIEVKVAGRVDAVLRQLQRYATSNQVDALILVTTRARHRALPDVVSGKPLTVVYLGGAA